ncbi:MAG TPA: sugar ABC transporter substrate-binding protein [Clostridia bacterium]|nr:sugar ABC transporter substrate-binding protein [Clostridia bacterium]
MSTVRKLALVFGAILFLTLSGCQRAQAPEQKPAPPPPAIGVSLISGRFEEVLTPWQKEMETLAKEKKIRLLWKKAKDAREQEKQFDELIKAKPDAIIAFLPEVKTARTLAEKAKEQDQRLLAAGVLPPDTPLDGFVGPDPKTVGLEQGEFVAESLREKPSGRVLIMITDPQSQWEQQVLAGNREGLAKHGGLQVIEREMPTADVPLALNRLWAELGALEAVITHDDETTRKVLVSLAGQPFAPVTAGIGASKETAQYIAAGKHHGEVDLEPEAMARYVFDAAVKLGSSGDWDYEGWVDSGSYQVPVLYTPLRVITRDNLDLLKARHGSLEPKAPDGRVDGEGSGRENSAGGGDQGQEKQGTKIKVKLKGGQELEFQVPGEVQGIEVESGGGEKQQQQEQKEGQGQSS